MGEGQYDAAATEIRRALQLDGTARSTTWSSPGR